MLALNRSADCDWKGVPTTQLAVLARVNDRMLPFLMPDVGLFVAHRHVHAKIFSQLFLLALLMLSPSMFVQF